ncbi:MAG: hypothetical protein LH467_15285 [Gemmatimonadaceae bacterium]|nr:hypothetical protein [Gemmatimonadaceae bacterium]
MAEVRLQVVAGGVPRIAQHSPHRRGDSGRGSGIILGKHEGEIIACRLVAVDVTIDDRREGKVHQSLQPSRILSSVLVVVNAEGHERVAQRVHETERGFASGEVGEKLIAEGVARVDEHDVRRPAHALDLLNGGEACEPPDDARAGMLLIRTTRIARLCRGVAGVDPELPQIAVDVVSVQYPEGAGGTGCTRPAREGRHVE